MNEDKNQKQPIQPPRKSKWKSLLGKKWTYPVIYIGAAALILAFILWFQDSRDYSVDPEFAQSELNGGEEQTEAEPVNAPGETDEQEARPVNQTEQVTLALPVSEESETIIVMDFYDEEAEDDVKAAAMVQYEDSFYPHTGIDFAREDGSPFDVIAALDGEITRAEQDPMTGFTVEIEHADGLVTVYQSLEDLEVKVGDQVKQGDRLGQAGRNLFEKERGAHLHFEVRENGESVSPTEYFNQSEEEEKQAQ